MAEYTAVSLEDSDNLKPSTILHLAAKNGQLETLDSRLNNGANCNIKDNTGQSALHYAALNGHYNCCERLLQCPSLKVNAVNIKGMSPLHLAALKDHYEIIKLLKKHDAQVNLKDKQDHLPLHFAAMKGFHESCEALLSVSDDGCNARDSSGHSPLHYAVSAGSDECCRQFLQCSNVNVNIKSNSDDTPLHYAAKAGHQNICNMLIKAENIKVNAKNIHEMTPLHLAAQENHDAVIKLLVENGAQVNLKDKKSQIPLHLAAKKGFLKSCEALLTDVSDAGHKAQDLSGNSPLHYVATGGHGDCCQRLLQCLDVDVNIKNNSDVTPLHYAAKMGHQNICIILLQNQNIDVNAINEEEMSALHLAAEEGYDEIINLLVQNSADVNLQDKKSHIPLHYAAKKGYIDSCRALLSHDRNKQLNATLEHGKTPLMLAVIEGQYSCCAELKNADINIKDHKENTALHYAVTRGFKKTVEQLLRMGAHPNIENKKGTTPVLAAAGKALSDCLVCLVNSSVVAQEERADLNVVDKSNKNILHYAAERNAKDCLKFLFSLPNFKTDLDGEDEDGNTPLHIAITRGSVECAHILLKNGASPVKQDLGGMTPLHLAADKGYTSICEILLINDDVQVSQGNSKKETPLHLAARCGSLELCQNLLQNGALLSATDKNGQTALHFAAIKGNANVVKFLTEKGMPRWIKDNSGSTAMHLAASVGSLECCQLLVVSDKNSFFIADKNGRLPLDRAFEHKHDDVFKFLLLRLPYRNIQERKTRILDYTYEGLKTNRPAVVEAIIESSWWLSGFTGLNGHKCENFKELVKRHPDLALKLQDKCIKHSHSEVTYYFRFLEDNYYIPPVSGKIAQSPFDKESGKLSEDAVQFIQDRLEWKKVSSCESNGGTTTFFSCSNTL
nr:serine/threonine-protein phosphatase 6 regulatory ankyrin repeat subunit A-like [Cherax quadricarinatus]